MRPASKAVVTVALAALAHVAGGADAPAQTAASLEGKRVAFIVDAMAPRAGATASDLHQARVTQPAEETVQLAPSASLQLAYELKAYGFDSVLGGVRLTPDQVRAEERKFRDALAKRPEVAVIVLIGTGMRDGSDRSYLVSGSERIAVQDLLDAVKSSGVKAIALVDAVRPDRTVGAMPQGYRVGLGDLRGNDDNLVVAYDERGGRIPRSYLTEALKSRLEGGERIQLAALGGSVRDHVSYESNMLQRPRVHGTLPKQLELEKTCKPGKEARAPQPSRDSYFFEDLLRSLCPFAGPATGSAGVKAPPKPKVAEVEEPKQVRKPPAAAPARSEPAPREQAAPQRTRPSAPIDRPPTAF